MLDLNPGDALSLFSDADLDGWIRVYTARKAKSTEALLDANRTFKRDRRMLEALTAEQKNRRALKEAR